MRVFENRVLGRIFGAMLERETGSGANYIRRCLIVSTPIPISLRDKN